MDNAIFNKSWLSEYAKKDILKVIEEYNDSFSLETYYTNKEVEYNKVIDTAKKIIEIAKKDSSNIYLTTNIFDVKNAASIIRTYQDICNDILVFKCI